MYGLAFEMLALGVDPRLSGDGIMVFNEAFASNSFVCLVAVILQNLSGLLHEVYCLNEM